jgi:hypothetical protein
MKLLHEHEYAASVFVGPMSSAALAAVISAAGFKDVRVWNQDDAEDPDGKPGNRDQLPDDWSKGLREDPQADHWVQGIWGGDDGDFPPPPGILTIVDMGDVGPGPATPPKPKGGGTTPATPPTPKGGGGGGGGKPAKPGDMGRVIAVGAVVVGLAGIVIGAWWLNRRAKRRGELGAATVSNPSRKRRKTRPKELAA